MSKLKELQNDALILETDLDQSHRLLKAFKSGERMCIKQDGHAGSLYVSSETPVLNVLLDKLLLANHKNIQTKLAECVRTLEAIETLLGEPDA